MKKYLVEGDFITVPSGELELSAAQAYARNHVLTEAKKGKNRYVLTGPTQFKKGEKFGYDGDLGKGVKVSEIGKKKAKAEKSEAEKAKAEKAAAEKAEAEKAEAEKAEAEKVEAEKAKAKAAKK